MDQSSSLLLDIDGLVVDRVVRDDAGRRVVHCSTDPQLAGWCPECGEQSRSPKAWVTTRPAGRPARRGPADPVVAQAEMALPGRRLRAEGVHRVPARADPRPGPDHHPGPPAGGGGDRRPHPAGVRCGGRVRHGLAHRARRVRRARRAGVARAAAAGDRARASTRPAAARPTTRPTRPPGRRPGWTGSTPAWSI